ncbi:hypothetical protein, partial [Streptococcus mutans]|uniref:hypothetical protein n=1 Tax=Streptococcus mutans TaxID=1309 RepID=UPI001BDF54EE
TFLYVTLHFGWFVFLFSFQRALPLSETTSLFYQLFPPLSIAFLAFFLFYFLYIPLFPQTTPF